MATNIDFILKNGLQVGGNVAVGAYSGVNAAPSNGMIVSGDVGIGSATPEHKLSVTGNIAMYGDEGVVGIRFADGTWQYTSSASSAVGEAGSIQFNDGNGMFAYSPYLDWDVDNLRLGIGTTVAVTSLHVEGPTPALFNTLIGTDAAVIVGNSETIGATLGYNFLTETGFIKAAPGGSAVISFLEGGVGINGVTAPLNALDVSGGVVIGSGGAYAGGATAPTDGLLVQGAVGLGTTAPGTNVKLDVWEGNLRVASSGYGIVFSDGSFQTSAFNSSSAVTSFSGGTTGLLPNSATTGTISLSGTLVAANGGTGQSSYTVGDILYASGSTALSKLAGVETGNVLISGGTATAPSWGKVGLTTHVSGTLAIANGGTNGTATPTAGAVAYGDGSAYAFSAAGSSGNVLLSGGAGTPTWGASYSSSNIPSTLVLRDSNGDFAANDVTVGGLYAATVQASTSITGQAITSNTSVNAQTVQASTSITGQAITSNTSINGQTLQTSGTATVNALISNTSIYAETLQVNTSAVFQTITSNATVTVNSGGINVTGASEFTGNVSITGNLILKGNAVISNANVLVLEDPIVYVGNDNPGNVWDLGIVGSYTTDMYRHTGMVRNHIDGYWTFFDNLITEPGQTIDWNQAGLEFPTIKGGTLYLVDTDEATNPDSGVLQVDGGAGINKNLYVGGNIFVTGSVSANSFTSNTALSASSLTVDNLQVNTSAVVQALVSNTSVEAQTVQASTSITGQAITSNTSINGQTLQTSGTATVNALVSNTSIEGQTLQTSGSATVNALTSNTDVKTDNLQVVTSAVVQTLVSNTSIGAQTVQASTSITGQAITSNTSINGQTLQTSGTATVNALVSNTSIDGQTLQTSGTATVNALVSNTSIDGQTLQTSGTATVNALVSNTSVGAQTVQASTSITGQAITSNTSINSQTLQTSGAATVNSLVSNTDVKTDNLQVVSSAVVQALVSNTSIGAQTVQASTSITGQAITSNTSINGQTMTLSSGATVNSLVSNTDVKTDNLQVVSSAVVQSLVSNTSVGAQTVQASTSITGQAITSNTSINGQTIQASTSGLFQTLESNTAVKTSTLQATTSATVQTLTSNTNVKTDNLQVVTSAVVQSLTSNTTVSGNSFVMGGSVGSTGGLLPVTVDTWPLASYRTVHYIAQVTDSTQGEYQASQFMVVHNDTDVFKSEYNIMFTGASSLGTFDAVINGTDIEVSFTANAATAKTIKVVRTGVTS